MGDAERDVREDDMTQMVMDAAGGDVNSEEEMPNVDSAEFLKMFEAAKAVMGSSKSVEGVDFECHRLIVES